MKSRETTPLDLGEEKQLFFDDYCIEEMTGLRRQLNPATKHGSPVLTPQEPWEEGYIGIYGNVLYDPEEERFRMWYNTRSLPNNPELGYINTICHATSVDGIHWERTRINQLERKGVSLYNAVMEGWYCGPTVLYTPDDPDPQRKYRMFVFTDDFRRLLRDENGMHLPEREDAVTGYGVAFSPDGYHWTPHTESFPNIHGGDIGTCCYDPVSKQYIAFTKIHRTDDGRGRRCVAVSISKNFLKWNHADIILSADAEDDARVASRVSRHHEILSYDDPAYYCADMYGMTGFRYEGLRIGIVWIFDKTGAVPIEHGGNEDGLTSAQLAYSRDPNPYGFWHRAGNREDFIPCGPVGDFDSGMVRVSHSMVEVGDELWFYYGCKDRGHGLGIHGRALSPRTNLPETGYALGLAKLRRDGFISLDSVYPAGTMTTKLMKCSGHGLEINAAAANGFIKVEVLDEQGETVPGYSLDDADAFSKDQVRGRVTWGGKDISALLGKPIRLVFHMQMAKFYAFKFVSA